MEYADDFMLAYNGKVNIYPYFYRKIAKANNLIYQNNLISISTKKV